MSGFTENRASEASERSGQPGRILTWQTSRSMLPLVGRIADDVIRHYQTLAHIGPELAQLERNRRQLDWPKRSRRYQLEEEAVAAEAHLRAAVAELEALGVSVLDASEGLVGFPTLVNQRRSYFSWRPGEESLGWWNYAGEQVRRPVPVEWTEEQREARPRRARPRKK